MIVGQGKRPSELRPNLAGNPPTTSDENWARILEDVDPPSSLHLHPARALRPNAFSQQSHRKYAATEVELRAMEAIFERVFDMDTSGHPHIFPSSARRGGLLSNSSAFSNRRQRAMGELDYETEFDKKREAMFACKSDQELLQWAIREVFIQPSAPADGPSPGAPDTSSSNNPEEALNKPKELHPGIYGRVVASIMKEFREQYNNPHLAIAIFDYTRRLSIVSYVTGCTAPSYNELMRTHWVSFHNIRAVVNVAEEMRVNGVFPDQASFLLLNQIQDRLEPIVRAGESTNTDVARLLERLGELLRPPSYEPIALQTRSQREKNTVDQGRGFGSLMASLANPSTDLREPN